MKKIRKLLALICCAAILLSTTVCMAETTEETEGIPATFVTVLDYVGEKDGMIECSIILGALEGSFRENVTADEITVKVHEVYKEELPEDYDLEADYANVSDVAVVSGDSEVLEVNVVIPKGELDADNFEIQGSVLLADGVMLDDDGNAAGPVQDVSVWTLGGEISRWSIIAVPDDFVPHDYMTTITLENNGAYVAEFYVYFYQLVKTSDGKYELIENAWFYNGDDANCFFEETFHLSKTHNYNIQIIAKVKRAIDGPYTAFSRSGMNFKNATLVLSGTTHNVKVSFTSD